MRSFRRIVPCLLACGLLSAVGCAPQGLYVSPGGSDENPGTWARPLRTIGRAAELIEPGQTCYIRGGTYRETVRPARSGEPSAPIVFEAFRNERVIISGCDVVDNWARQDADRWTAPLEGEVHAVFADGRLLPRARHPNHSGNLFRPDLLAMQATPEKVSAQSGLDQPAGTWDGATLWGIDKQRGWVAHTYKVAGSRPGELHFDPPRKGWWNNGAGRGYLFDAPAAMDAPGEWLHRGGTLRLIPPEDAPRETTVEVARRRWAFDLSGRRHVQVKGVRIRAAGVNGASAENCRLEDIHARWVNLNQFIRGGFNRDKAVSAESEGLGIVLGGRGNVLIDSTVAHSWGDGVTVFGHGNRVENCIVRNVNYSASDCAPVSVTGTGHVITRSTLHHGGRSIVVHRYLQEGRITHNHMHDAGMMSRDLGMTYTYHTDGNGTEIAYNVIHSNHAEGFGCVGIYLDDWSRRHVVHHNVVYGVSEAVATNPPKSLDNLIINNTLDGFRASLSFSTQRPQTMTGTRVANNIFTHRCMDVEKYGGRTDHNLRRGTDPRFVDAKAGDYRLRDGSPAIDAGVEIPPYTDGFLGSAPDQGAYEHGKSRWRAGAGEEVLRKAGD
ncbi:MAG: right-handed parallel beta-helix repeat-containing protein [Phycisphaerae bacterium]